MKPRRKWVDHGDFSKNLLPKNPREILNKSSKNWAAEQGLTNITETRSPVLDETGTFFPLGITRDIFLGPFPSVAHVSKEYRYDVDTLALR